jgi:exoribonuclease II
MLELSPCKNIVSWREQISARMRELMSYRYISTPIDNIVDIEVRQIQQHHFDTTNIVNVISLTSISGDINAGYGGYSGFDAVESDPMLDVSYNSAYVNSSTQKFFIIIDSTEQEFRDSYEREFDVALKSLSTRIEIILGRILDDCA